MERKFLVDVCRFPPILILSATNFCDIEQTYLSRIPSVEVRLVRGMEYDKAYLIIKEDGNLIREEFAYEIPFEEAVKLARLGSGLIKKTRWEVLYEGLMWELDFFHEPLKGLTLARYKEVAEAVTLSLPCWAKDITLDPKFNDLALSGMPDPASFLDSVQEMLT